MKKRYLLSITLGFICTAGAVSPTAALKKSAAVAVAPVQYVGGLAYDAFDYTSDMLLYGVDSTRSLNIAAARSRDLLKSAYFIRGRWSGFQKAKDDLNVPSQGASTLVKALYLAHKSKKGENAKVRVGAGLSAQEERFIYHRTQHVENQITNVFKDPVFKKAVAQNKVPRIAVCASGGGFRAMMATAGMLQALEQSKLIDLIMFMSVLSGSTWVTVPRALGQRLDALIDGYLKYAKLPFSASPNTLKKMLKEYPQMMPQPWETEYCKFAERQVIRDNWLRKFYFAQPLDAIDLYGAIIAHMVLAPFDDPEIIEKYPNQKAIPIVETRQRVLYSQAVLNLENNDFGSFPLPIATAVSPVKGLFAPGKQKLTKSKMMWFEFTPYEMGTEYHGKDGNKDGAFVPTWAMGRKFKPVYGKRKGFFEKIGLSHGPIVGHYSVDNAPELPLSNLLGTWGSAFAFSVRDLIRILGFDNLLAGNSAISPDTIFKNIISLMTTAMSPVTSLFKNARIFPSTINNFMHSIPGSPQTDKTLTLVDAGIDFNLPFPPLMRQARDVDVIIVMDASMPVFKKNKEGTYEITELVKAEQWAQAQGVKFPKIVGTAAYKKAIQIDEKGKVENAVTVFEGQDGAPTVIFVPLVDNKYSEKMHFKLSKCMEEDCNTFNFKYSEHSVKQVIQAVSDTVSGSFGLIEKAITKITKQKLGISVTDEDEVLIDTTPIDMKAARKVFEKKIITPSGAEKGVSKKTSSDEHDAHVRKIQEVLRNSKKVQEEVKTVLEERNRAKRKIGPPVAPKPVRVIPQNRPEVATAA